MFAVSLFSCTEARTDPENFLQYRMAHGADLCGMHIFQSTLWRLKMLSALSKGRMGAHLCQHVPFPSQRRGGVKLWKAVEREGVHNFFLNVSNKSPNSRPMVCFRSVGLCLRKCSKGNIRHEERVSQLVSDGGRVPLCYQSYGRVSSHRWIRKQLHVPTRVVSEGYLSTPQG